MLGLGLGLNKFVNGVVGFALSSFQSLCSYYFNGVDSYASLGSHVNSTIDGASTFSLRMVFKFVDIGTTQYLFTTKNATGYGIRFHRNAADNKLWVWFNSGSGNNVWSISGGFGDTDWHELIITYDTGTVNYYVDGSIMNSGTWVLGSSYPTSLAASTLPPILGSGNVSSGFGNSYINQIQVTSDIITETEAGALWHSGEPLVGGDSLDNVEADYIFDNDTFDGTDWTLIDRTGNGNGITSNVNAVDKDCNENPY